MPLYDCMLLLKPKVERAPIIELVSQLGKRVHSLNGVVTDIKSFGKGPIYHISAYDPL